jgi:catalase
MMDHFNHIEPELAKRVAEGLGVPAPTPIPGWKNHGRVSTALSMLNGPKSTSPPVPLFN